MCPDRLTDLYRSYGPAIYSRCRSLLADERAAEDATQETFLRMWRHLDRLPDGDERLYWIYRVATNYCLNELRNRQRRGILVGDLPDIARASRGEEARIEERDLARHLIEHANAKVRVVAWLYHVDAFEQEEIAAILGVSRRTVANRLSHFLGSAQRFLKRSGK